MSNTVLSAKSASSHAERLAAVRAEMTRLGLDLLVVRSTDPYLNEYVPRAESTREWLTGFSGSLGDALVAHDAAWLFVDGRYHAQADREVDLSLYTVVKNALGITNERACGERLIEIAKGRTTPAVVGYEADRYSITTFEGFEKQLLGYSITLRATQPSVIETVRGEVAPTLTGSGALRIIDEAAVGRTVREKQEDIAKWLAERNTDALWVSRLDELAWLTNLRGDEMPYQATFRGSAVVTREAVYVCPHVAPVTDALRRARPEVHFVTREGIFEAIPRVEGRAVRVAIDPASVSVAQRSELSARGYEVLPVASPIVNAKAKKNPAELTAMRRALRRADRVVADAQKWLIEQVSSGATVSEVDFAREVERLFREAGAVGLSFKVISAFGTNGAVVHHSPSDTAVIREGDLMLLDTGCYFEEGYATDLTRTFFVGRDGVEPTDAQRMLYTRVLKAAIAGMDARFPKGAVGAQLDGVTRAPMWRDGFDYAHGTGHGVGINVHESPPSVAKMSTLTLEEGHVFSIEPGLYLEGVGGVRIENLCTVTTDDDRADWLRVTPLTFSPLDVRLTDRSMLDARETAFLDWYSTQYLAAES